MELRRVVEVAVVVVVVVEEEGAGRPRTRAGVEGQRQERAVLGAGVDRGGRPGGQTHERAGCEPDRGLNLNG